ncbi:MAG: RIP metalloprotease RseP [Acidobacteriota bacterium]
MLLNVFAFLIALGVIVTIHELGHHLAAKAFGIRVDVFSVGFGQRVWGFVHAGTDYRISAVPLGGYVRMGGDMLDEVTGADDELLSKPRWQRILVYLAGPLMNVALAVLLIALAFMHGIEIQSLQDAAPVVGRVIEGGAGEAAQLQVGDRIVAIDDESVKNWEDVNFVFSTSPEKALQVRVLRDGAERTVELVPELVKPQGFGDSGLVPQVQVHLLQVVEGGAADRAGLRAGDAVLAIDGERVMTDQDVVNALQSRAGEELEIEVRREGEVITLRATPDDVDGVGMLNVYLGYYRKLPPLEAFGASVTYNIETLEKIGQMLGKLFTREVAAKSVLSGPIEIGRMSGQALRAGPKYLVFLMGFLSLSIGVMNLLPIPVLDGGHIAILLVESGLRRDLSRRIKDRVLQAGFLFLVLLMTTVIFFDLSKNLPRLLGGS